MSAGGSSILGSRLSWIAGTPTVSDLRKRSLTPRNAAWLVLRRAARRDAEEADLLNRLCTQHAALTEAIAFWPRTSSPVCPQTLRSVVGPSAGQHAPGLPELRQKLGADDAAVRAAMTLSWSTGQVEEQINRLKMIKRQMFGRASFDFLNRRLLLAA